ncbi:MAG TPA: MFS transporter, partial [Candidatus Binataceae bacterium]|nr:MFS transporter [Candidatus Binataceae bacterium]
MTQNNPQYASASPADSRPAGAFSAMLGISDGYLWTLLALLMSVTIFEGYDVTIFHLCTPDIAKSFHLDDRAVGTMASFVRLGGMIAFFIVMLSDRIGRKPIMSMTVLFYAGFTFLTAISRGLWSFTAFQSGAQIFLSAEFGVAIIMISEEFPDSARGRGVALLHMVGLLGVVAGGFLYGRVADSSFGWRGMYFIGIAPLLLVAFLRRSLRETGRFEAIRATRKAARTNFGALIANAFAPFRGPYRGRLLLVALLWNSVGLVGTPAVTFFSLYAKRDHHWTSTQIGQAVVLAYIIGSFGHLAAGWMLDRVGRKATISLTYIVGAVAIFALFQTATHGSMLTSMVITVVSFQAARTATATYSAELFPTEIRATSYSMTVNLLGAIASLATPFTIGVLSHSMGGLGNAVAVVSIGPVIGAVIVMLFAPETRGASLEELSAAAG